MSRKASAISNHRRIPLRPRCLEHVDEGADELEGIDGEGDGVEGWREDLRDGVDEIDRDGANGNHGADSSHLGGEGGEKEQEKDSHGKAFEVEAAEDN